MKKRLFLILVVILLLPIVLAEININGPLKSKYNLGDVIEIDGYILNEQSGAFLLNLMLECGNLSFQLPSTSLTLASNEKKQFPEEFIIPKLIIPRDAVGECVVNAKLVKNSEIVDQGSSVEFSVLNDLKGNFDVDKTQVQVGDSIVINGNIFRLSGDGINGSAQIYLNSKNSGRYLIDIADVTGGVLNYNYVLTPSSSGLYMVDVLASDIYGNQELFENVSEFLLINELVVSAQADKFRASPGDSLRVSGEVKTFLEEDVSDGTVKVSVGGNVYSADIKDSSFSVELSLSNKIKSGKHVINVLTEDLLGNIGETDIELYIEPIASTLRNEINADSFIPGDVIEVTPLFYDQAGDLVVRDVIIEIKNPKGKVIFNDVTQTNKAVKFTFPEFSLPGGWEVVSSADGIEDRDLVNVGEYLKLDFKLDNQTLVVMNVGNVEFRDSLKIEAGEYVVVKKTKLGPDESFKVYLDEEFPSGRYMIRVLYGDEEERFDNVEITGRIRRNASALYAVIIIVLILVLVYLIYSKSRYKRKKGIHEREKLKGKKRLEHLRETIKKDKKPSMWKSKEEEVKDFRDRILKDIRKVESGKKGELNLRVPEPPK